MKVLMTGFDPFGGEPINPAEEAVKRVSEEINGAEVIKLIIPTVQDKSLEKIDEAIDLHKPDFVICVGQAGGRFDISPEKVAINLNDFRIPDNEGNQPTDSSIKEDGEIAYFSNLPVKAIVKHLRDQEIPASLSYTAGTFVCNHVMYGVMYMIDKKYPNIKGGFIHIPFAPSQVMEKKNTPYMSLDDIVKGLELVVEACTLYPEDIKVVGGEIL
ncbi:MAG: pyroglutamyl-peptidase I [Clostridioides sp.]|nr:pyroglutamyl-peptidase I [Clostridioides sp.]